MKTNGYIIPLIGICIFTLFMCATATAATQNKDLPTKDELISVTESFKVSNNYVSEMSAYIQTEHSTWKFDVWEYVDEGYTGTALSVYYKDPTSSKGYGSLYYDETGRRITSMCGVKYNLIESYTGEPDSNKEVTEEKKTDVVSDEDERADEVKKIKKLLTKYKSGDLSKDELKDKIDGILKEE